MKRLLSIVLLSALLLPVWAQQPQAASQRPKVGIVLGGGGAKGAAHIGVLKYMEEIGIPVDYVAGTSMGSIIGGLYALGYSPDEMARLIAAMDWSLYMSNSVNREYQSSDVRQNAATYLLSVPFGSNNFESRSTNLLSSLPSGVINGASLINLFTSLSVGYQDSISFDELPIPFACVATDILTGDSVVLRSGVFAKAIRSSMAIPGVFSPVKWGKHLLADGGLVNNFPVDVCKQMGADVVIGIELAEDMASSSEDLQSLVRQASQYLSIAVKGNRFRYREMCDIYMHPDITGYNMLSFSSENIDTLVRRGYEIARQHDAELRALKARLEASGPCAKQLRAPRARQLAATDTIVLSSVSYKGVSASEYGWLNRKCNLAVGDPCTMAAIDRAIGILRGTGAFSSVTYSMTESEEEYWIDHGVVTDALGRESFDLTLDLVPAEPHCFALGFRYDSEESADLLFHFGWNEQRLYGLKCELDVELSYNFRLGAEASYRGLGLGDVSLRYDYSNNSFDCFDFDDGGLLLSHAPINHNKFSLFFSEFHLLNFTFRAGIDEDLYSNKRAFSLNNMLGEGLFRFDGDEGLLGFFITGQYEDLDAPYFARTGHTIQAHAELCKDNRYLLSSDHGSTFDVGFAWSRYVSPSSRFTLVPQLSALMLLGEQVGWLQPLAGGIMPNRYTDHQLAFIGLNQPLVLSNVSAVARLDARCNVYGKFYLSLMANYLVTADHFDHFFAAQPDFHDCLGLGFRVAYASPIGPISVDLHWNNNVTRSLGAYVNIGYQF